MANNNIGFHTRSVKDQAVKYTGGSFGGQFDMETVNRLVNGLFTVKVKGSGRLVFVDREGRECWLYVTVDPVMTDKGKAVLAEWREKQRELERQEEEKRRELDMLLGELTVDEALRLLKGE